LSSWRGKERGTRRRRKGTGGKRATWARRRAVEVGEQRAREKRVRARWKFDCRGPWVHYSQRLGDSARRDGLSEWGLEASTGACDSVLRALKRGRPSATADGACDAKRPLRKTPGESPAPPCHPPQQRCAPSLRGPGSAPGSSSMTCQRCQRCHHHHPGWRAFLAAVGAPSLRRPATAFNSPQASPTPHCIRPHPPDRTDVPCASGRHASRCQSGAAAWALSMDVKRGDEFAQCIRIVYTCNSSCWWNRPWTSLVPVILR
jgi:hypothetical protein